MKRKIVIPFIALFVLAVFALPAAAQPVNLVEKYSPEVNHMGAMELQMEMDMGEEYIVIDVRTADEYKAGRIPGATHVNFGLLPFRIGNHVEELDQEFIVVCKSGGRSTIATKLLQEMGYSPINLDGGFMSWMEAGYTVETAHGTFVKN